MDIFVVDIETTDLNGYPDDLVLEIAIMKVNLLENTIIDIYNEIIHYDTEKWDEKTKNVWVFQNSNLTLEDITAAKKDLKQVSSEVHNILKNKFVTSYNIGFDFDKFLKHEPWNINPEKCNAKFIPCIMETVSDHIKVPTKKGFALISLENAKEVYVQDNSDSIQKNALIAEKIIDIGFHRASYDAFYASCILLELWSRKVLVLTPKIYYSHSMQIYGKEQEKTELTVVEESYPNAEIINPSDYEDEWSKLDGKEIMEKCLNLIHNSDIVVFSTLSIHDKNLVGKGVFDEVKLAEKLKKPVYFLFNHKLHRYYSLGVYNEDDWTQEYGIVKSFSR